MSARGRVAVVALSAVAAIAAWLGWFQIAPALGFPTIGPAAMLNRVFVPGSNPGIWVGWVVLIAGLAIVTVLFVLLGGRAPLARRPGSMLLYGLAAWVVGGLVLMPIIGHIAGPAPTPPPPPGPPIPTTPDPMHATLMMLHLGGLAPVDALLAWLLFAAILGAAASALRRNGSAPEGGPAGAGLARPVVGLLGAVAAGMMVFVGGIATATGEADAGPGAGVAGASVRVLSTGRAAALPPGQRFVSVIELPQAAGARLGPHGHIPGFAYVLRGQETIAFPGGPTMRLSSGHGGFMGALAVHSHDNRQGRVPAGLLAAGLLVLGIGLVMAQSIRWSGRRGALAVISAVTLAAGALAIWNPWANDWFFIGVRPASARGGVMPLPNATRTYESPDLQGLATGPYVLTLAVITVPGGGRAALPGARRANTLLVLKGVADVEFDGGNAVRLGFHEAATAQEGTAVTLSNAGAGALDVLSFTVTPGRSSP